jgi:hypothetical protein
MEVIEFFQFAELRAARGRPAQDRFASPAPEGDRWAQLHSEGPDPVRPMREAGEVITFGQSEEDFWSDLQFRLAYPTHRLRAYRDESSPAPAPRR